MHGMDTKIKRFHMRLSEDELVKLQGLSKVRKKTMSGVVSELIREAHTSALKASDTDCRA